MAVEATFKYWNASDGWDYQRLQSDHTIAIEEPTSFLNGLGRSIGPLVNYYRATSHGPAPDSATALKEKAIVEFFPEDGAYPSAHRVHWHSTICAMSSLAQLADPTLASNHCQPSRTNGVILPHKLG